MNIINLSEDSKIYTCNVYFILGTYKSLQDPNTLIDVGRNPFIIEKIKNYNTGIGKKRVEKVILTHSHFDHISLIPSIIKDFSPQIYTFFPYNDFKSIILKDGEILRLGDRDFEIIHTPGHTYDSICIYCKEDGVLFSGDTNIIINNTDGTYSYDFVKAFERIVQKDIKIIYPGHGKPIIKPKSLILESLNNIKKSKIISVN